MSEKKIVINRALASKVFQVVDKGLTNGKGDPKPGKMCVEAAVCYALGLPHSDEPPCVGQSVRNMKIELNDQAWESNKSRAQGLREVAIAQLGSDTLNQDKFCDKVNTLLGERLFKMAYEADKPVGGTKKILDFALKNRKADPSHERWQWNDPINAICRRGNLNNLAEFINNFEGCEFESLVECSINGVDREEILKLCANTIRDVLIDMKSPGAKFLFLCEK